MFFSQSTSNNLQQSGATIEGERSQEVKHPHRTLELDLDRLAYIPMSCFRVAAVGDLSTFERKKCQQRMSGKVERKYSLQYKIRNTGKCALPGGRAKHYA